MNRLQATVAKWLATQTIFDVCAREMGYEGGGRLRLPWWRQKAADNEMMFTVEAILTASRVSW